MYINNFSHSAFRPRYEEFISENTVSADVVFFILQMILVVGCALLLGNIINHVM